LVNDVDTWVVVLVIVIYIILTHSLTYMYVCMHCTPILLYDNDDWLYRMILFLWFITLHIYIKKHFNFFTFHGIFRSVPFRSVPFRSVPFRSVPFRSVPFRSVQKKYNKKYPYGYFYFFVGY